MLSFFGRISICKRILFMILKRFVNTMSLQVRCSPLFRILQMMIPGKRVLPFTSMKGFRASMTVEAAMVLPLFVFFAEALLMPMRMLDMQRKIQTTMEMSCEELSISIYMAENQSENTEILAIVSDAAAGIWLQGKLAEYEKRVRIENIQVPDENGDIILEAVYREQVPFFSEILNGITLEVSAKRRGWIGMSGKLKEGRNGAEKEDDSVEMVYVGQSMGRYHRDRNCHYISNDYQAVSVEEAKEMRDADGHRLTACSSCGDTIKQNGTVYITERGRHYHGSMECGAMASYVRKVPILEVGYLGACSYCGRIRDGERE